MQLWKCAEVLWRILSKTWGIAIDCISFCNCPERKYTRIHLKCEYSFISRPLVSLCYSVMSIKLLYPGCSAFGHACLLPIYGFTCDIPAFRTCRGAAAYCFQMKSEKNNKRLVSSTITTQTRLLSSSPCLTLQSSECVCVCVYTCAWACVYKVCAYMCQKLDMILSPVKALDHPAQLAPDLTVQLN